MRGLPQKQNARRAYKIRLCGHLRKYKKIVKKTYIIYNNYYMPYCGRNIIFVAAAYTGAVYFAYDNSA